MKQQILGTYPCIFCGDPVCAEPRTACDSKRCQDTLRANNLYRASIKQPGEFGRRVGVPESYWSPWRDDISPVAPMLRRAAEDYVANIDSRKSLFLAGKPGTGKSRTAALIAELVHAKGKTIRWYGSTRLFARLRDTQNSDRVESEINVLEEIFSPWLVILDDLGVEKPSEWVLNQLYLILNERIENNKRFVITANFTLQGLKQHWSRDSACACLAERLVSRIGGACNEVTGFGDVDLRRG